MRRRVVAIAIGLAAGMTIATAAGAFRTADAPHASALAPPALEPAPATIPSGNISSGKRPSAASGQSPSSTSLRRAPLLIAGTYVGRDPRQIDFSVDEGNIVTDLAWASWSSHRAVGQGLSDADSCVPNCATAPVELEATTITLCAPSDGHFTVITERRGGRTERFTYPAMWPVGATRSTPQPAPTVPSSSASRVPVSTPTP